MALLERVTVAAALDRWRDLGFAVDDDGTCRIGTVDVSLGVAGKGLTSWHVAGLSRGQIDGLATEPGTGQVPVASSEKHPNGTTVIDHLVVFTPDLDRTVRALEGAGLVVRRTREDGDRRQIFFRLGEVILEVIGPRQPTGDGPARFYGLALTVADLDATAAFLGDRLGRVKDAVQPGRRIATLRKEAGAGIPLAFMSPEPSPES